ncbi:MAG: hypothetical protein JJE46_11350 [Acidimicrobiia bacterium]|nr:hypothetical protein [Acidimicrobiia bacterium]
MELIGVVLDRDPNVRIGKIDAPEPAAAVIHGELTHRLSQSAPPDGLQKECLAFALGRGIARVAVLNQRAENSDPRTTPPRKPREQ